MAQQNGRTNGKAKSDGRKDIVHVMADQSPPYNLAAEQGCLGMAMRDPESLHEIVETTQPEHFWRDIHQWIARVIWDQYGAGLPCDALAISEELTRQGKLKDIGGDPYLVDLCQQAPSSANGNYYANIIHQKWMVRQTIEIGNWAVHKGYSNTSTADALLDEVESRIFAISDTQVQQNLGLIGPAAKAALDRYEARREGVAGIPSGLFELDDMTDGWQPGQLVIVGARPSMGKTALALNFADHAGVNLKVPVLFVSLEMSKLELAERMISSRARVGNYKLKQVGRLSTPETIAIGKAYDDLREPPLWIDDTPTRTALKVAAAARRIKAKHGLGLVIIDYLQLVDGEDHKDLREEKIAKITRRFKVLARELQVPVILLSQLNRNVENREKSRPRMSDLRESGAIEQDADIVILLHRPEYYDPDDQPGIAELIVAKNRNGATGTVKTTFLKQIGRFENLAQTVTGMPEAAF